uniref:Uncharacterized protein n=1 Tax=Anguilla anguilla TaxID=7936 RepID=A0A0E9VJY3_ANGAN
MVTSDIVYIDSAATETGTDLLPRHFCAECKQVRHSSRLGEILQRKRFLLKVVLRC